MWPASSPIPSTYPLRPASPQLTLLTRSPRQRDSNSRRVKTGLASLTFLASPPGRPDICVVEQPGRIRRLVNGVRRHRCWTFPRGVASGGERGMLSLAFDPQFTANGSVFVYFTDATGDIAVERFTFPFPVRPSVSNPTVVRSSHRSPSDVGNHNGGQPHDSAATACFTSVPVMVARRRSTRKRAGSQQPPRQDPCASTQLAALQDPSRQPVQPVRPTASRNLGLRPPQSLAFRVRRRDAQSLHRRRPDQN